MSDLDFTVSVEPTFVRVNGMEHAGPNVTVRQDTGDVLGVVAENYPVCQNSELFDLAETCGMGIERTLMTHNGAKVALLLKDNGFTLPGDDKTFNYMYLYNGHDGKTALGCAGTNVRVFCMNQHNLVMKNAVATERIIHSGDWDTKMVGFQKALDSFNVNAQRFEKQARRLASVPVSMSDVMQFYRESYALINKKYPDTTTEDIGKFAMCSAKWQETLETELQEQNVGANLWHLANSVTYTIQHSVAKRGRKADPSVRAWDNALGSRAKQSSSIMSLANTYAESL